MEKNMYFNYMKYLINYYYSNLLIYQNKRIHNQYTCSKIIHYTINIHFKIYNIMKKTLLIFNLDLKIFYHFFQ